MRDGLFLTPLAKGGDFGLLLLRWVTGAFLVWQSHDNILGAARMEEFVRFLEQFRRMVHWPQDFPGWWPAPILVFLGILFATLGDGRYALDTRFGPKRTT